MNIVENIKNYLNDKNYAICLYNNYLYIFKYDFLNTFSNQTIDVVIENRKYLIYGNNISLIKMTSEELLFKGLFNSLKVETADE